jgi:hypothetical protein
LQVLTDTMDGSSPKYDLVDERGCVSDRWNWSRFSVDELRGWSLKSSSRSRSLDGSRRTYRGVSCNAGADAEDITIGSSPHNSPSAALIGLLLGAIAIVVVVDDLEIVVNRFEMFVDVRPL